MQSRPIEILLVEDNPADIRLTVEAFRDSKIHNNLSVVTTGTAALAFVRQQGKYDGSPRPDLILLDLGLPELDGRDVLAALKADENLKSIPVVVLTPSHAEQDILTSYELQASCHVIKPVDIEQLVAIVRAVEHFWVSVVALPSGPA